MKVTDIIFALILGRILGFLIGDFLREWEISIGLYWSLVIWLLLPLVSLLCLWIASHLGKKFPFIFQAAKFLLVGAAATVFDLKIFEFLVWLFPLYILAKSISFFISTSLKYWGNKYWAFQKHEKENMKKEIIQFFSVTAVGLIIDIAVFYYATQLSWVEASLAGQQIPSAVWLKFSVIFAAIAAAVFNFLGYKFLVFKK